MIITRSPLRISLGGGGTDLPSYYREHGGFLIAAAIDKYVYITLHQTFVPGADRQVLAARARDSRSTRCSTRSSARRCGWSAIDGPHLEITSMADIPAGTGLGSSGSFTTALLKALHTHKKNLVHPQELAEQACHIEIDRLGEPIGKQDQYIAAFGGLTCFQFLPERPGRGVAAQDRHRDALQPRGQPAAVLHRLHALGLRHPEGAGRQEHGARQRDDRQPALRQGARASRARRRSRRATCAQFAELMNVHWEHKKQRSGGMSNDDIDDWYDAGAGNGALGGKLIGAGGGGFLMFYAEDKTRLRHAMREAGLAEVRFRFDFEGTKVVAQS